MGDSGWLWKPCQVHTEWYKHQALLAIRILKTPCHNKVPEKWWIYGAEKNILQVSFLKLDVMPFGIWAKPIYALACHDPPLSHAQCRFAELHAGLLVLHPSLMLGVDFPQSPPDSTVALEACTAHSCESFWMQQISSRKIDFFGDRMAISWEAEEVSGLSLITDKVVKIHYRYWLSYGVCGCQR